MSLFARTRGVALMKNAFVGIHVGSALMPIAAMLAVTVLCTILSIRFFSPGMNQ